MNVKKRRDMRLREFDYSLPGAYFLTVCTKSRRQILSAIHEGCTILSAVGRICETQLLLLEERYPVRIERHVIMPNHVHMLLSLYRAEQSPAPTTDILCSWKSATTKLVNTEMHTLGNVVWQRSFYDHVVRNEDDFRDVWQYIDNNPKNGSLTAFILCRGGALLRPYQRDSLPEEKRKSRRPGAKYRQFLLTTAARRDKIHKLSRNRQKLLA